VDKVSCRNAIETARIYTHFSRVIYVQNLNVIDTNQSKIEAIIDDYISFSNKMQGRATLSAAEKIIQEQLKK